MKTLKLSALALFATVMVNAQDLKMNDVPSNVNSTFQKEYNNATDVEWEMDEMNYKVEFDMNDMEHEIWYTKEGQVVKTERELSEKDLPSAIVSAIKSKYSGYDIDSVEMTEMENNKTYEVELEKGWSKELKVVFDANGTVKSSVED